ncbi:MAG: hypothetical protein R2771_02595 [Saprospiraceae bacterium]
MDNIPEYQDYIYGNILVISTHENGEEFWSNAIPKSQNSINDNGLYSSFGIMTTSTN